MPGALLHLAAGTAMVVIGRTYFQSYFKGNNKTKINLLLLIVCLFFSIIPDFFLIIYYTTYILPFEVFLTYHNFVHIISGLLAITILIILKYFVNIEKKPIFIMGMLCILLHVAMDIVIPDLSIWL